MPSKKKIFITIAKSFFLFNAFTAWANPGLLYFSSSLGSLEGEANRYVYDPNTERKLSHLNWKFHNAAILKGDLLYDLNPWFSLNMNGSSNIFSRQAVMDDYDWMNPRQKLWTDWSHHEDSSLKHANKIDFNIKNWLLRAADSKFGVMLGFEREFFDFDSRGGYYQYANGQSMGCFTPYLPVITYNQTFKMPYMGLIGNYAYSKFNLSFALKYSPIVLTKGWDYHVLREVTFRDTGDDSQLFAGSLKASYALCSNCQIFAEADFTNITLGKSDVTITQHSRKIGPFLDANAVSNQTRSLLAGILFSL